MVGILYLADQGFSFTAKAIETISGGQIVRTAVSGARVLTSTNAIGDLVEVQLIDAAADPTFACGVAINTAASGGRIGVACTGIHGFYAGAAVTAGSIVHPHVLSTADAVQELTATTSGAQLAWGQALTSAASGELVAVRLIK